MANEKKTEPTLFTLRLVAGDADRAVHTWLQLPTVPRTREWLQWHADLPPMQVRQVLHVTSAAGGHVELKLAGYLDPSSRTYLLANGWQPAPGVVVKP
jgi:hypothetical protein